MAWVERRVTRTSQPQDACGVDWTNPITRALAFAFNPAAGAANLADGKSATTNNTSRQTSQSGVFAKGAASQRNIEWANYQPITTSDGVGTGDFTIIAFSNPPAVSGGSSQHIFAQKNDAGGSPFAQVQLAAHYNFSTGVHEQGKFTFAIYHPTANQIAETPFAIDGNWHMWSGVRSGTTMTLSRDDEVLSSTTSTVRSILQASPRYLALGGQGNTTASSLTEGIGCSFAFNRALSYAELKSLYKNPWQIFEPEVERIWISDYIATGGLTQVQSDASLNYVLQAITFNSQGGMYSILGLVNSDINSSYNVTEAAVNSTSASYFIQSTVQQSQNEEYNVLASLSSTQGSTYNVRSALSKDQGSTYFISESTYREQLVDYVIRSQQHNDQSATYSILSANSVGNNADLNYVISALIQQDQQENYLVRSSAHQETNGVYTVRSSAESTTEGSYAVRASLTGDATLDYSIRAEVNSSGSMSYTVRASLSKDQGLMYDILAANNVSSSSGGSYIIQATTANNTSCSYQIQGEVIDVPLTNAEMQQLYAWVSELVTKSATKEEIATAVWSKPQSELTVENSIGKWLMQKVLTVSKFLALK